MIFIYFISFVRFSQEYDFSHAGQDISRTAEAFFMTFSVSSFHIMPQNECFKIFLIQTFLKFSWSEKKFFSHFLSPNFGGTDRQITIFRKKYNSSILYFYILRTNSENNSLK